MNPGREPDDYRWTDHFHDVMDDPLRYLTEEMVAETIRRGEDYPEEGGPGKLRRKAVFDGIRAVLVLPVDDPVVVTGWTEIADCAEALLAGYTDEDLQRIAAFEDERHKQGAPWEL